MTPLESVYSTNLYEVLAYISIFSAKETYKGELQEAAHKNAKKR